MAQQPRKIPTVDISSFFAQDVSDAERLTSAKSFVETLHNFGFAKVIGHGLSADEVSEALGWVQKLFGLPYDEKMKAPHPSGPMPHRGYSGIGQEKVYSQEDIDTHAMNKQVDVNQQLRKVSDYKASSPFRVTLTDLEQHLNVFQESYEIGSESDPVQTNIWLPGETLPGFRQYETSLYERLCILSKKLLDIIAIGLGWTAASDDWLALENLISDRHCQLRLLHYPAVSKALLQQQLLARLPAHRDWG